MTPIELEAKALAQTRAETVQRLMTLSGKGKSEIEYFLARLEEKFQNQLDWRKEMRRYFAEEEEERWIPQRPPMRNAASFVINMTPSDPTKIPLRDSTLKDLGFKTKREQIFRWIEGLFAERSRFNLMVRAHSQAVENTRATLARLTEG